MTGIEVAFIAFLINKLGGIAVDQAQNRCFLQLLLCLTQPAEIHARVDRIISEFKVMQTYLEGSNAAADNQLLEAWIEQIRKVALNIEDIIDEYLYLVGRQRECERKNCCPVALSDLYYSCAMALRGIDSGLEKNEKHLSQLSSTKERYGITVSGVRNSERDTHGYGDDSPTLIDKNDLVGKESYITKLVSWLNNGDTCRQMTKIAVWGMVGLGKTTLVAYVFFNANKSHFYYPVWVTVSQTYSVEELLRIMIQKICESKEESVPNGIATMQQLELSDIIRKKLQQKRYIIVLDGLWGIKLWRGISAAFVDSNNGSRLIVTTRWIEVARIANDEHIIKVEPLDAKDARDLFCKKAFQRENSKDCPKELEKHIDNFLNKCGRSPLAIDAIGSLLSCKEKTESEWNNIYDRLLWEFENNSAVDKEKNILNLCFNDLPSHLRNCFAYCSIFPEDYPIKRKKLIRLWVAEGFIEARSGNKSMEEEADGYLAELVDRSMFQVIKRNEFGRLKAFRMHGIVRLVALITSRKAKFCMILDGSQSNLDNQTRRLSIQRNVNPLHLNTSLSSLTRLGSLVVFTTLNFSSGSLSDVLTSFKMLKVLELEKVEISKLPNEVSALFNLHYLGLRGTKVAQLPDNIQKLQNLQTLDLRDSKIVKLPHGVTQLKQLRHLFASACEVEFGGSTVFGCVSTLKGACQWKNLQTLRSFKADEKLVQQLADMEELRSLEVEEVEQAHCPQLCTSLNQMNKLRSLRLSARSDQEQLDFETLNSPPPQLQKLVLLGRLFEGKVPTFIYSCSELACLQLFGSQLLEDPLPSLGQLRKLVVKIVR